MTVPKRYDCGPSVPEDDSTKLFSVAANRYIREIFPSKSAQARKDNVIKFKLSDIHDGALWVVQNKTGVRLGISITGELAATIARFNDRPNSAISSNLIQDENGQWLPYCKLHSRFDKARTLARIDFKFRDIRGKAATDTGDLAHSQKLLAHKNRDMTEHYVKARMGERVNPLR